MNAPELALSTSRLELSPLTPEDTDSVFAVFADPATWHHLPSGRHERRKQSELIVAEAIASWTQFGLGQWAVRMGPAGADGSGDSGDSGDSNGPGERVPAGEFIGIGGVTMTTAGVWNLGYRLSPTSWGRGFATELSRAAITAATKTRPTAPITARILSTNPASVAVARRVGLARIWRGPSSATDLAQREIYSDRPLADEELTWLVERA